MQRLTGKVALITGAGSGLVREGAVLFVREGARVAIMDRVPGRADVVAERIIGEGGEALAITGDDGVEADMNPAVDATIERFTTMDIFWANAAHFSLGMAGTAIEDLTQREWPRPSNSQCQLIAPSRTRRSCQS